MWWRFSGFGLAITVIAAIACTGIIAIITFTIIGPLFLIPGFLIAALIHAIIEKKASKEINKKINILGEKHDVFIWTSLGITCIFAIFLWVKLM